MPAAVPLIGAVGAAAISKGVAIGLTSLGIGALGASIVGGLAGGLFSFGFNAAFGAKPKRPEQPTLASTATGRTEEIVAPLVAHRIVLGRVRVSGALVFIHAKDSGGRPNQLLYQVHVLAAHQCRSVASVMLADEFLSDTKFSAVARVEWKLGTATQSAIPMLVDETEGKWTSEHRALGRCILASRLTYDESVFRSGRPTPSAIVEGRVDIYDPRTGTTGYSTNPALVVAWYLTWRSGFRVPHDGIDWPSVIEAANICDEVVALADGGAERRYSCNGTFQLDEERGDVLTKLLASMGGSAATGLDGKWYVRAGAWRPPSRHIDEDWLRGGVRVEANRQSRDLFNGVRATYVRPEANWQPVDAPPLLDAAALAADGGDEVYEDFELSFTTSGTMAQRLMRLALNRNRAGRRVALPCTLRALTLVPGDTVTLSLPRLPEASWRIVERTVAENGEGVDLVLEEDSAALYAWSIADEKPLSTAQDVTVPDGAVIGAPTITVTPPTAPVPTAHDVAWSAVAGATAYDLSYRLPNSDTWVTTSEAGTSETVSTAGRAAFRVRAKDDIGQVGNWTEAPFPAALSSWSVTGSASGFTVSWAGAPKVQVFTSAGTDFAASTKTGTDPTTSPTDIAFAAGAVNVWLRAVSDRGVVGAPVGPAAVVAQSFGGGDGGSIGAPGEGSGGEGGGESGGGPGSSGDP